MRLEVKIMRDKNQFLVPVADLDGNIWFVTLRLHGKALQVSSIYEILPDRTRTIPVLFWRNKRMKEPKFIIQIAKSILEPQLKLR